MSNILLIEPDYILAKTYSKTLKANDFDVTIARSAQSAIYSADKVTPDLIILELQLIEHSGIEFLYEFRSYTEWQNIPIIVLTQVPPSEFNQCWQILKNELKVSDYLYKPYTSLKKMLKSINELILVKT